MVRPENTARLTVTHRPTMFTYRDLKHERQKLCLNRFVPLRANESGKRAQVCSHLCVSQGFAGDVALHLRLVDGVDGHPHDAAADHNGPESVSPQRIWVKAKADGILKKQTFDPFETTMTKELSHLLKRLQSAPLARIFPDLCQAALQDRSPSDDSHKTSQHDHHLYDVCPDHGFQATL